MSVEGLAVLMIVMAWPPRLVHSFHDNKVYTILLLPIVFVYRTVVVTARTWGARFHYSIDEHRWVLDCVTKRNAIAGTCHEIRQSNNTKSHGAYVGTFGNDAMNTVTLMTSDNHVVTTAAPFVSQTWSHWRVLVHKGFTELICMVISLTSITDMCKSWRDGLPVHWHS